MDDQTPVEKYVNCRSLTVRFDCSGISFLTAGDIEEPEKKALVEAYSSTGDLNADIMKLSHHGLNSSNREALLNEVSPRFSYALNSGKQYSDDGNYRLYYSSCKNASKFGPVYLVGDEKQDFHARVSDGSIRIFKGDAELKGLVTLAGGDGTEVKTYKYYITGNSVSEGVYTVDGNMYYISQGGFVNKAFYSHDQGKYIYRCEPVEGGPVRYVDKEGILYTGFRKVNEYYRYFDTKTGIMKIGDKNYTPVSINKKKYAINENGFVYNYGAKSGTWKKYGSNYRYFGSDGVMKTGWTTVDGVKYYLDKSTGLRFTGFAKDEDKYYYVKDGKKSTKTGFVKVDGEFYQIKKGIRFSTDTYEKCGNVYMRLSTTSYTYNGKEKKPSVKIYNSSGSRLSSSSYTVKYASGRKNVGKYKVTVNLKGKYSGTEKLYFKINPKPTKIDSISSGVKSLKVKIEKESKQVTGYQVQYSTSKSFDSAVKKTIKSYKTTSTTLSDLKSAKTYYVRVRTYKTVDGTKYYSSWSDYVSKKTK